jgi:hypothetical protein
MKTPVDPLHLLAQLKPSGLASAQSRAELEKAIPIARENCRVLIRFSQQQLAVLQDDNETHYILCEIRRESSSLYQDLRKPKKRLKKSKNNIHVTVERYGILAGSVEYFFGLEDPLLASRVKGNM